VLAALLASCVAVAAVVAWLNVRGDSAFAGAASSVAVTPALIERGAYLARAGNCATCHTQRGGAAYAGGRAIDTPFGQVFTSNLTPDAQTGIGGWSAAHFWRAMHNGRSKDGRLLYPAFPYPNFTQLSREDSDAIYAWLQTQPAVASPNRPNDLRFPYSGQAALAVWRALYFRPEAFEPERDRTAEWNRGAYLVRGLGHCIACHSTRNALGASEGRLELSGGLIPLQNWYAPSLASAAEASVADWDPAEIVALLKTGTYARGSVLGPMAEVVYRSTQHLDDADLRAVAVFLKTLPQSRDAAPAVEPSPPGALALGGRIYADRCAACHGDQGQGAVGAYPPLAGNRKVSMTPATNVVRVIVDGGFPPTTQGNPRPYGMPPFGPSLSNAEIAAVVTYVRNSWGNAGGPVSELDVLHAR
jgi:mono/diheme cytochrome c family protein